jgi:hypothetical protein
MHGLSFAAGAYLNPSTSAGAPWAIRGLADLDGDGKTDILWHNASTGELYAWFMDGINLVGSGYLTPSTVGASTWKIVRVADFNHDGKADILWHNQGGNGDLYVWFMNGTVFSTGGYLTPSGITDTTWAIVPK